LEEEGGVNLYGFVGNGPVMVVDLLGLIETLDATSAATLKSLESTSSGKTMADCVRAAEKKAGKQIKIRQTLGTKDDRSRYIPATKLVVFGSHIVYKTPENTFRDSTNEQELMHELQHALDDLHGRLDKKRATTKCSPGFPNEAEESAVNAENAYLKEKKLPTRLNYVEAWPR
jgi:hypothetical protein